MPLEPTFRRLLLVLVVIVTAPVLPESKSRPPIKPLLVAVGEEGYEAELKTAISVAPGATPPVQFDPVAHVTEVLPVQAIFAAFAVGIRAKMKAIAERR